MRRLITIAAFVLALTVPVWAQHGGGHGGGGGHAGGGFSGGHAGGFSGGHSGFSGSHASSGVHAYSGARSGYGASRGFSSPGVSSRGFATRGFSSRAGRGPFLHNGTGLRFRTYGLGGYGFRNNCYGWRCWGAYGYPWWGYDPLWWSSDSNYDDSYNQNVAAAEMNRQNLEEQQMMRQEQADGDQDAYAHPPHTPRSAAANGNQGDPMLPATVLVFRDRHKQEVQNYAIVGQTLWSFAPQHTEKIPLADLDITATTKANEERGVTFRVPAASPNVQPMQGQPLAPVVQSPSV